MRFFTALLVLFTSSAASAAVITLDPAPERIPQWDIWEQSFHLDREYDNPYDPIQVDVTATVSDPDGSERTIVGFWMEPYERMLVDGIETFEPSGDGRWMIRYAPMSAGEHEVVIVVRDDQGTFSSEPVSFEAAEPQSHGFVRPDPDNAHFMVHDDGRSYVPLGWNICWSTSQAGLFDWERYLEALADNGGNATRLWMTHFGMGWTIEWGAYHQSGIYEGLGRMSQPACKRLDDLFALAQERDVRILLVLNQHSQFETAMWSSWADNPYNAANGGPCATSMDYFTGAEANRLYDIRVRYMVARYGAFRSVMAWELWNEIDLIEGYSRSIVDPWQHEKAALLRSLDPVGRPITTSYSNPFYFPGSMDWESGVYDLVTRHSYLFGTVSVLKSGASSWTGFGRPCIPAELGLDFMGEAEKQDTRGIFMHNMLWAGPLLGYAGGGMNWWWDEYIEPYGVEFNIIGPTAFFNGETLSDLQPQIEIPVESDVKIEAFGLINPGRCLAWVHDPRSEWNGPMEDDELPLISGAEATLSEMIPGAYNVEFWDTFAGEVLQTRELLSSGALVIVLPDFKRDIALKVSLIEPPADDDDDDVDDDIDDDDGQADQNDDDDSECCG